MTQIFVLLLISDLFLQHRETGEDRVWVSRSGEHSCVGARTRAHTAKRLNGLPMESRTCAHVSRLSSF